MINFSRKPTVTNACWTLAATDPAAARTLADELAIHPVVARLLAQRLSAPTAAAARSFLQPQLSDLHPPEDLPDMDRAAQRLAAAVGEQQRVIVYGDYDADGVTATALTVRMLNALGLQAGHYLPCRLEEGYGISDRFVEQAISQKPALIVTVDCGTAEAERIARLVEAGIDVIVTDHHEAGSDALPPALAVVNPKREREGRELAGVGVAFKLAWATCRAVVGAEKVGERLQQALLSMLPLVAVGTIADVMPLLGENRVLAVYGMQGLRRGLAGLKALMRIARVEPNEITARAVAFGLAPRLNAAGRMGEAELALKLLLADDRGEAGELAERLDRHNRDRQELCRAIQDEAKAAVEAELGEDAAAIVVAREGWHEGVIGIVAGRLAEDYGLPAAVIALDRYTGTGKGSARSVDGLNLYEAMDGCRERFLSFGGHEQAAGFAIAAQEVDALRAALDRRCRQQAKEKALQPTLALDAEVGLDDLDERLARALELLAPFGEGNPEPRFLCRGVTVRGEPATMGRENRHFSWHAERGGACWRAVVFNNTDWLRAIDAGTRCWDIVYTPYINRFRGKESLELRIVVMRPAG